MSAGGSSFLIYSVLPSSGLPGLPGCKSLFFASPKKSNQKKGDPQSGPLCGSLKKLKEPENLETSLLRSRRTSRFLIRLLQLFQAQPGRGGKKKEVQIRIHSSKPVLAGLRSAGGSGNKFLGVRRLHSRLVSKNSADFEHRKLPGAKRRDPDCGSPFFWLLCFWRSKEK